MRSTIAAAVVAGALTLTGAAAADLGPPDGYVETCTRANAQTSTSECLECVEDFEGPGNRCTVLLAPFCFHNVCNKFPSSWVYGWYCRTKSADAPTVPDSVKKVLLHHETGTPTAPTPGPGTCAPYAPPEIPSSTPSSGCSMSTPTAELPFACLAIAGAALASFRRLRRPARTG